MTLRIVLPLLTGLFLSLPARSQRIVKTINSNWEFCLGDTISTAATPHAAIKWTYVTIPHTWNANDVADDEPGYYRGMAWYRKQLYVPDEWKNKEVYLFFNGAAQRADVFINGKPIGDHTGSYTAFSFPITSFLSFGGKEVNFLQVKMDNSNDENVPPLSGDFTFFGGIYRDVQVMVVNKIHFDMENDASGGVFISTPAVSSEKASVHIAGAFVNKTLQYRQIKIIHQINDADGNSVNSKNKTYRIAPGEKLLFTQDIKDIPQPKLWSPESPYLYQVVSTLIDAGSGEILDEIVNPLGFRWYRFDAGEGFFLNGKPLKLIGASRHQDYKGRGNAVSGALQIRDVELLKEMGGNFLRVAHYPQDRSVLQACDRLGILASVETPLVNRITETDSFAYHAKKMHQEMIRQYFNHPSIIIWAYMNEVLLRPRYEKGSAEQEAYFKKIAGLARELEQLTRKEDPYRYTMIPNHGNFDLYNHVQLTKIPMLVGWNIYEGWYSGGFDEFGQYLDRHRKELPDKPVLITEYGADADVRLHSFSPLRFDKTVEYAVRYHRAYLKAIKDRPFVAGAVIWNLSDFNSESRAESTPHINSKGILTNDREAKDPYRFYQANLRKKPYIAIGSSEWTVRGGTAASAIQLSCTQPVQVFSNQKTVILEHNGESLGTQTTQEGIATFNVPFVSGMNQLKALSGDGTISDQAAIHFELLPTDLRNKNLPFQSLNISLGDERYCYNKETNELWFPEKAYTTGSWGYIGGSVFKVKESRAPYGSDKDILGTGLDPVFATQRIGLQQFKMDVPDGNYEVTLLFAELLSRQQHEELAYNLAGSDVRNDDFAAREFNVTINSQEFLEHLSNSGDLQPERAVNFKTTVLVSKGGGITIAFNKLKGEPILNGIKVRRLY